MSTRSSAAVRSYDHLVPRLAEYARRNPGGYRARVAALALLGYGYLAAVVLLLLGVLAGCVWLLMHLRMLYLVAKLAIPVLGLLWVVARALWVRVAAPAGLELRRADAPALWAEVDGLRRAMRAPRIHRVLVDDAFNAAVAHMPRLGVFGWPRHYLRLGLPLMQALPPDELRAVLAHELGHVSRAHGRFGSWIYRLRATWANVLGNLTGGDFLFAPFFRWYAPYFEAYTAVLARQQEFEADELAAEAVGAPTMGAALCRVRVGARHLSDAFWPAVWSRAAESERPPQDLFARLGGEAADAAAAPDARRWLQEALVQPTQAWDSHPALVDRLEALGVDPVEPAPAGATAAQALLGERAEALAARLGAQWAREAGEAWAHEHERQRQLRGRLAELDARAADGPLPVDEAREHLWLVAELRGDDEALPPALAFLEQHPDDASIHFLAGRVLAERDDEAAVAHLERAMALDYGYTLASCALAAGLMERLGRDTEAIAYHTRQVECAEAVDEAQRERSAEALTHKDRFLPHGLDDAQLAQVRAAIVGRGVKRAYLVRKEVRRFPEEPLFVLAVVPSWSTDVFLGRPSRRLVEGLLRDVPLPGNAIVLALESDNRPFARPLRAVPGSEVYRAGMRMPPAPQPAAA
ncbi:MAG TPA: M48 family metalloprotease [Longimicrobium sp.]|nr:M48 family metalloprotease [Longimicrobium sp.]